MLFNCVSHTIYVPNDNKTANSSTLDAVFPEDLFSDYLEITTSVIVPCGGPKEYPRTSI